MGEDAADDDEDDNGEEEEDEELKPLNEMADGETIDVKGGAYRIKRTGDHYYCTWVSDDSIAANVGAPFGWGTASWSAAHHRNLQHLNALSDHMLALLAQQEERKLTHYGVFTLSDTETENDNDNYGFLCNNQKTSHYTETLSMMPLATFSLFIGLGLGISLDVAQCEHTITVILLQMYGLEKSESASWQQNL